jgi:hypothetical protein
MGGKSIYLNNQIFDNQLFATDCSFCDFRFLKYLERTTNNPNDSPLSFAVLA